MMPTKARGSAMDDGNGMVTLMYRLDTVRHKITIRNRLTTDCNCLCLRSGRIRPKPIQGCPKRTQADPWVPRTPGATDAACHGRGRCAGADEPARMIRRSCGRAPSVHFPSVSAVSRTHPAGSVRVAVRVAVTTLVGWLLRWPVRHEHFGRQQHARDGRGVAHRGARHLDRIDHARG